MNREQNRPRRVRDLLALGIWSAVFLGVLAAIAALSPARAAEGEGEGNLELKGTLIAPPPCTLNGDNTIGVHFGDRVGIKKVASGIYRQPVDPGLVCEPGNASWQLTLSWTGTPADFDAVDRATVVSAEQAALGVKLYADGRPLALDEALSVNAEAMPALEAVLVQDPDGELEDGPFTARATLRAEYQ
jgi:type 1 fimbria pilin